jgi:molybdate transport system ATP-binding protein
MIEIDLRHHLENFALDVTFKSEGGVVALFGPSGAGKTTIVNAIAGLIRPDEGRIVVNDRVLFDSAKGAFVKPHRRRVGYVFQDPRLFPHMTVLENLRYGQQGDTSNDFIELLGLAHLLNRYPRNLSGGEAQRVAIGRALFANPEILLMDEPLAALDAARKAEILPYLAKIRDTTKVPIFYVSHAMSEVAQLANDIVLIKDGKVARHGPIGDILSDPNAVPDLGIQEAGAVILAILSEKDSGDGLSKLATTSGDLYLPKIDQPEGTTIRVRIQASDIILAKTRPTGLSALNILPVEISSVHEGQGPGVAIGLTSGTDKLIARITRRSQNSLALVAGTHCYAIIKSVSIAPSDVGGTAL